MKSDMRLSKGSRMLAVAFAGYVALVDVGTVFAEEQVNRKYKSFDEAKQAAEGGEAQAQFELAAMYANGEGVVRDERAAFEWSMKAAKQGHALAQAGVGAAYMNGKGVTKDTKEGVKWLDLSARQGEDLAVAMLACIFLEGHDGVDQDEVEAAKWFIVLGLVSRDDNSVRAASAGLNRLKGLSTTRRQEASRRAGVVLEEIDRQKNRKR